MKGLKTVLIVIGAVLLVTSLYGFFTPWPTLARWAGVMGFRNLQASPLVVYAWRLSSLVFALVAVYFFFLASDPLRYRPLLGLSIWGLLLVTVGAILAGGYLHLHPPWYLADAITAFVAAVLLLIFWPKARTGPSPA